MSFQILFLNPEISSKASVSLKGGSINLKSSQIALGIQWTCTAVFNGIVVMAIVKIPNWRAMNLVRLES